MALRSHDQFQASHWSTPPQNAYLIFSGASIRIGPEIGCLPYGGFLNCMHHLEGGSGQLLSNFVSFFIDKQKILNYGLTAGGGGGNALVVTTTRIFFLCIPIEGDQREMVV